MKDKNKKISLLVTEEEHKKIKSLAGSRKVGPFIKSVLLLQNEQVFLLEEDRKMIREVLEMKNKLSQIGNLLVKYGDLEPVKEVLLELREVSIKLKNLRPLN